MNKVKRTAVKVSDVFHEFVHALWRCSEVKRCISYYRSRKIRFHSSQPKLILTNVFPNMSIIHVHLVFLFILNNTQIIPASERIFTSAELVDLGKESPKKWMHHVEGRTHVYNRNCVIRVIVGPDNIDNVHC